MIIIWHILSGSALLLVISSIEYLYNYALLKTDTVSESGIIAAVNIVAVIIIFYVYLYVAKLQGNGPRFLAGLVTGITALTANWFSFFYFNISADLTQLSAAIAQPQNLLHALSEYAQSLPEHHKPALTPFQTKLAWGTETFLLLFYPLYSAWSARNFINDDNSATVSSQGKGLENLPVLKIPGELPSAPVLFDRRQAMWMGILLAICFALGLAEAYLPDFFELVMIYYKEYKEAYKGTWVWALSILVVVFLLQWLLISFFVAKLVMVIKLTPPLFAVLAWLMYIITPAYNGSAAARRIKALLMGLVMYASWFLGETLHNPEFSVVTTGDIWTALAFVLIPFLFVSPEKQKHTRPACPTCKTPLEITGRYPFDLDPAKVQKESKYKTVQDFNQYRNKLILENTSNNANLRAYLHSWLTGSGFQLPAFTPDDDNQDGDYFLLEDYYCPSCFVFRGVGFRSELAYFLNVNTISVFIGKKLYPSQGVWVTGIACDKKKAEQLELHLKTLLGEKDREADTFLFHAATSGQTKPDYAARLAEKGLELTGYIPEGKNLFMVVKNRRHDTDPKSREEVFKIISSA